MNQVLKKYSNRIAILDFHEYLLASGGLGLVPQEVYKRVVVPNANVKMVLSGHYHSAQKTVSKIDMDGDGVADRNVVNLLFDYQAMSEGGMGFIRLMHINTANATMQVRTYSPSLGKYGSQTVESSDFTPSDEEFTIDLTQLGIKPVTSSGRQKTLTTDSFDTDLRGGKASIIGTVTVNATRTKALASNRSLSSTTRTATPTWTDAPTGTQGWYAFVRGEYSEAAEDSTSGSDTAVSGVSTVKVAARQPSGSSTNTNTGTGVQNSRPSSGTSATASSGSESSSNAASQGQPSQAQSNESPEESLSATGTTVVSIATVTVLMTMTGVVLRTISRLFLKRRH